MDSSDIDTPAEIAAFETDARSVFKISEFTFSALVRDYAGVLRRYALRRVGPDRADDVVSETFADAWVNRDRFNASHGENVEAWLMGIATFIVARNRRAERRWLKMCIDTVAQASNVHREQDLDEATAVVHRMDVDLQYETVARALASLRREERDALLLHTEADLSYEDVAIALGIPIGTVRSRIHRAKRHLSSQLEGHHHA